MTAERVRPTTSLGVGTRDTITVVGKDLATELMGHVDLGDMAFLVVAGKLPTAAESRLFNAALVALCDHGMTPMVIASRLTITSAPESIQGAMAAGLLGVGDLFLGVVENTAQMLREALQGIEEHDDDTLARIALGLVEEARASGTYVPGLGHRYHKDGDPRTQRLYELADQEGIEGPHMRLLRHIGEQAEAVHGRYLPINGAGAAGAVFADLGFDPVIIRGFAVLSRAAGLVGQLWEEHRNPMGRALLDLVGREVEYVPPDGAV